MKNLKRWVMKEFFAHELELEMLERKKDYENQVRHIKYEANKDNKLLEIVRSVAKNDDYVILGIGTNKDNNELLVVHYVSTSGIWIELHGERYNGGTYPRIMASYSITKEGEKSIFIEDVITKDNDIGNGSVLMPYFIKFCKKTDAKCITGKLSPTDKDHFNRIEHFYKKFGFSVSFNLERTAGQIRLDLR